MGRYGWDTAELIAHPHHLPRAQAVFASLGIETTSWADVRSIWDRKSSQPWTRSPLRWAIRELFVVLIYLLAGAMQLFGPSVGIVRMVPSLLGLITAIVLGWLVYRIFRDRWLGLATFAVTGTLPWLFIIGRIGFEVSALPTALALFLLAWVEHRRVVIIVHVSESTTPYRRRPA